MSDLCLYELEDNVWDEFGESDDHIVPHPSHQYENHFGLQGHGYRKPLGNDFSSNTDESQRLSIQKKEEVVLPIAIKKDKMLEKDSWSHSPDTALHTSCNNNSVKEVTSVASKETRMSSRCLERGNIASGANDLRPDDIVTDEKCTAGDDNTYHYPLSDISQTENDLGFLDSGGDEKERSDLLYYEWPDDIGNFEDVDRMFRSCDSTFGLGSLNNEDDFCWFSSSHSAEASDDAVKLGSKRSSSESSALNNASEHSEASRLNSSGPLINDSKKKNLVDKVSPKTSSTITSDHSTLGHLSYLNGSDVKTVSKVDLVLNEQANWQKKQTRDKVQLEGRGRDVNVQNGVIFQHNGNLEPFADVKHSFGGLSSQVFPISGVQHEQYTGTNSFPYIESQTPFVQMEYNISDQTSVCTTATKSENDVHLSSSAKESSYASNLVRSMESSRSPDVRINDAIEKLYHSHDLHPSFVRNSKHGNMASPAFYNPEQKEALQSEYDIESHSEIGGVNIGVPAELDSSTAQDSSCMSSVLDEISLEATSFRQLQQVMEQLDIRTKLCIRDSLYRLARSAEQRHNCEDTNVAKRDDREVNGALTSEEANKASGFMDMETDTNPIDRSVAHLLFHRPSDASTHLSSDAPSFKSPAMINGSTSSPAVIAAEKICQEEAAATDRKITSDG